MRRPLTSQFGTRWTARFALIVVAGLLASVAHTQDLVALARKERERRAKIAKPTKVLTEEDGKGMAEKGGGSVTTMEGTGTSSENAEPATSVGTGEAARDSWKARAVSVRAEVVAAEGKLGQLEHDLAVFRSDQVALNAEEAQDPMRLQKREATIAEMNKAVELQRKLVAEAKRSVTVFEEEARRNGVPPGWLR
jgi:hypothetical protein